MTFYQRALFSLTILNFQCCLCSSIYTKRFKSNTKQTTTQPLNTSGVRSLSLKDTLFSGCFINSRLTAAKAEEEQERGNKCQRTLPELKRRGPQRLNKKATKTTPTHLSHCCASKPHYSFRESFLNRTIFFKEQARLNPIFPRYGGWLTQLGFQISTL